ncbi:integrin alpha-8-like [Glandiceps talaboti]
MAETGVPGVKKGGAVYRCPTWSTPNTTGLCQQIPFDTSGPLLLENGNAIERKSDQWFGATVKSSGKNGVIIACAPRYVYFTISTTNPSRFPLGICYTSRGDFSNFNKWSPCTGGTFDGIMHHPYLRWNGLGNCQAGMSTDVIKGIALVVGAPGSYSWQGQIYVADLIFNNFYYTLERDDDQEYDNYAGYSVAIGQFSQNKYYQYGYAVGAPKGNAMKGKVDIYSQRNSGELEIKDYLFGEQMGSYFGYSICVSDVNADGRDDVIVGAPYYTDKADSNDKWDAGRVYVYHLNEMYVFDEPDKMTGDQSGARFGSAVAAIGDVNLDGYNDIAVGAPYYGNDNKGAVFIYHGSENGIRTKISQVIRASDINANLKTFGSSLAGGLDMDNNQYSDILVGAYASDKAVLLRSRPVVNIKADVSVFPEYIDLEKPCHDGAPVACFSLKICFSYTGIKVPTLLDIEFTSALDSLKERQKRAYYKGTSAKNITGGLTLKLPNTSTCREWHSYIKKQVVDKYSSIAVDITYKIPESAPYFGALRPVQNQYAPSVTRKLVHIQRNCGNERICVPDLSLTADFDVDEVLIGGTDHFKLQITLANRGEDSFETKVSIQLPAGFDFIRAQKTNASEYIVSCLDSPQFEGTITCSAGNPLKSADQVEFAVTVSTLGFNGSDYIQLNEKDKTVEIYLKADSTHLEESDTLSNNDVWLNIPVNVNSTVLLTGVSTPEFVWFYHRVDKPNFIITREGEIGPEVRHFYEVRNLGPNAIDGADVTINWPAFTPAGGHLLYLLDVHLQDGPPCVVYGEYNPEKVTISRVHSILTQVHPTVITNSTKRRKREETAKASFKMDCSSNRCLQIKCSIDFVLQIGQKASIEVRSRLWKDTLMEDGYDNSEITSTAQVQVTSMPYSLKPDFYPDAENKVSSVAVAIVIASRDPVFPVPLGVINVSLWVLLPAVLGGLVILLCVIVIMWWNGFFRRKRIKNTYYVREVTSLKVDVADEKEGVENPQSAEICQDEEQ